MSAWKSDGRVVGAVCALVALAFAIQGFYIDMYGDDICYTLYGTYYEGNPLYYPRWILRHWWLDNGRMANYLTPLMLYYSPRWLLCVANGVVTGLMVWLVAKLCVKRQPSMTAGMTAVALMVLTMAWWDASVLFDVSFNYVWASCFGLAFVYVVLYKDVNSGAATVGASLFALCAGMMHEAMSIPLVAGLAGYYIMNGRWRGLSSSKRRMIVWFAIGAVVCLVSPGIWRRFGSERVADDPMWLLLLKSDFYALLLVVAILALGVFRPRRLKELIASRWVIFAVAALASSCFCAVGGIVGRSGWFAQIYSIVALAWMLPAVRLRRTVDASIAAVLGIVVVANLVAVTYTQIVLGRQWKAAMEAFRTSRDGTFYLDAATIDDVAWWTLKRPRGATPNNQDASRQMLQFYYGKDYVMIPTALRDDASLYAREGDGWILTTEPHSPAREVMESPYQALWTDSDGRVWNEVSFSRNGTVYYFSEPLRPLPGDRFPLPDKPAERL